MTDSAPDPHAPPPATWRPGAAPARAVGQPRVGGAVPRMETVRVTAPDLARRAQMEVSRTRLAIAACGFMLLFGGVAMKLADATIIGPLEPRRAVVSPRIGPSAEQQVRRERAMITDRNGEILAVSLPTAALFANPREMIDVAEAARKLKTVLRGLDVEATTARLSEPERQFVYLARQITPREQVAINALGIPGVYFEPSERRHYPLGRTAVHLLGGTDVDGRGIAGVERFFDQRLREEPDSLRLSIDVRIQSAVRDVLAHAIADFNGIGGAGAVMDVRTGEMLAMVSLPDYDAADTGSAPADQRFNRITVGVYEPGSTFKLLTAAMALDDGNLQLWNGYDASRPLRIGRFTINDFRGKNRWLSVPEIITYSSNIGAAQMAMGVGPAGQRAFMQRMGMMNRVPIELPETALPLVPPERSWKEASTLTIGFGQGIAVTPLHVIAGVSALANGGILMRPTILAPEPDAAPRQGVRVVSQQTSDTVRRLMRLVVTEGSAKEADVPGYFVGGKTGTAQKTTGGRGYTQNARLTAFVGAFPIHAPRYAIYLMVDEPKPNARSHGFATAGWVVAPAARELIQRIGPMLGILPVAEESEAIRRILAQPLQPARPASARRPAAAPRNPAPASAAPRPTERRPTAPAASPVPPPPAALPPPVRREASFGPA